MASGSSLQANNRIHELCQRIRRNTRMLAECNDPRILDEITFQLDLLIYHLNQMRMPEEVIISIAGVHSDLVALRDEEQQRVYYTGIRVHLERIDAPGRPRYHITEEQLAQ